MLPVWLNQIAEEQRLRASDAEFDRVVSMGMGPRDTGTEEQEVGAALGCCAFDRFGSRLTRPCGV